MRFLSLIVGCLLLSAQFQVHADAQAQAAPWTVRPEWVSGHMNFLASDALQGRGSATRDELIAANYIAAQFESYGLKPAPGMSGYVQKAVIPQERFEGKAGVSWAAGKSVEPTLFMSDGQPVQGRITLAGTLDPKQLNAGKGEVLLADGDASPMAWLGAARQQGVKLLVLRESEATRKSYANFGGEPRLMRSERRAGMPAVLTVPGAVFDQLTAAQGQALSFTPPRVVASQLVTTNAIGYLQGTDPKAGTLLFTAHLDHLGLKADGTIMHGANDNASGTVAVMELARALAGGTRPKRSILFVCFGGEELGLLGAGYFTEHPPVPLKEVVANLEFEMIGAQDPTLPQRTLMMTGYERSDFGEAMAARGFRIAPDPYPAMQFFQRSDNYQLAVRGVVAHTVSGWATTPTYHQANDDLAHIDLGFMTTVIQSLIEPARWLADGDFVPQWKAGQKP
ncbi:M28 family metallopeptidase [Burkholderiaceae bacterium UC74_6]